MGPSSDSNSSVVGSQGGTHVLDYLANFIENSLDAIVASDTHGRIVFWNLAAERTFGWNTSEALGKSITELFWATNIAQGQEDEKQRQLRLQRGEVVKGEQLVLCKDGSPLWIAYTIRTVIDNKSAHESAGYVAVYRDISERKRAEEQLERSNQKLNVILDSIQDDFYVLDRDWIFVYANRQFTSKIGKEPEDFVGNNIWEMFPKHLGGVLYENFLAVMGKREVRRFEIPGRYTDAWYRMTVFPSDEGITVLGTDITERKRAEEQLRYQATLLSNVSDAVIASDAQFHITAWNSAAESMYGWKAEEVIGCNGLEIVRTAWPEKDAVEMRRTIAETGHWRGEATQVHKDGSRFPVEIASMVLYDDSQKVIGYVSVNRDITERKQVEEALRKSQERLQQANNLLEAVTSGVKILIATVDKDFRYTYFNKEHHEELKQLTGKETKIGMSLAEVLADMPDQLKVALDIWGRALNGETISQTIEFGNPGHHRRFYRTQHTPIRDGTGNVVGAGEVTADITDEIQLQEALRKSEHKFSILFEKASFATALSKLPDGVLVDVNKAWVNVFGFTKQEAIGKTTHELNINPNVEERARILAQLQQKGSARNLELALRTKAGEWRSFLTNVDIIEIGGQKYLLNMVQDITERKLAENALRESENQLRMLNETLERRVNKQTAEVRRLASELTKVEQRERQRVARILHEDLQQRLYAVKMQLSLLEEGLGQDPAIKREFIETNKQVDEILSLTRNLTIELSPPILHDEGLKQAFEWLAMQMKKQQGLNIDIKAQESFAIPDEAIQVLLFNCVRELLFNIVKHAGVNRAIVVLQRSGDNVRIEVRDEGKGFNVAALAGSGKNSIDEKETRRWTFGLSTLRHQLSLFGGQMDVLSEPGAGTCVTITIPHSPVSPGFPEK